MHRTNVGFPDKRGASLTSLEDTLLAFMTAVNVNDI